MTGGTTEPVTEMAEGHDIMIASVLQALDVAFTQPVWHSLGSREPGRSAGQETSIMLALMRSTSDRVQCGRVNYYQYDHTFANLRQGHMCEDSGPAVGPEREERY